MALRVTCQQSQDIQQHLKCQRWAPGIGVLRQAVLRLTCLAVGFEAGAGNAPAHMALKSTATPEDSLPCGSSVAGKAAGGGICSDEADGWSSLGVSGGGGCSRGACVGCGWRCGSGKEFPCPTRRPTGSFPGFLSGHGGGRGTSCEEMLT